MSAVLFRRQGPVAIVTLNRPERLNAIGGTLLADLHAAVEEAQGDESIGAIVLTGAGRAFCAGDDLKEFADQTRDAAAIQAHISAIQRITRDLMLGDKPVIGAVHGYAVGGGFEWLLNCDLVVAADDLVAFFPEMDWGQFVTGGVTYLLPLAVGYQRAMELMILGERQSAARLRDLGIVNWVVPRPDLMPRALAIAEQVAAKSRFSVAKLKRALTRELNGQLETGLQREEAITIEAFSRSEAAERVRRFGLRKST